MTSSCIQSHNLLDKSVRLTSCIVYPVDLLNEHGAFTFIATFTMDNDIHHLVLRDSVSVAIGTNSLIVFLSLNCF
jgi:hypothetical protein